MDCHSIKLLCPRLPRSGDFAKFYQPRQEEGRKRCREPLNCFLGRPWGRSVILFLVFDSRHVYLDARPGAALLRPALPSPQWLRFRFAGVLLPRIAVVFRASPGCSRRLRTSCSRYSNKSSKRSSPLSLSSQATSAYAEIRAPGLRWPIRSRSTTLPSEAVSTANCSP